MDDGLGVAHRPSCVWLVEVDGGSGGGQGYPSVAPLWGVQPLSVAPQLVGIRLSPQGGVVSPARRLKSRAACTKPPFGGSSGLG